jgi:hypothetical protein
MRIAAAAMFLTTALSLAGVVETGQGGNLTTNRPFCGS